MSKLGAAAAVLVLGIAASARAEQVLIPDGGFESTPQVGFQPTITGWTVAFAGAPAQPSFTGQHAGVFTSFGKFGPQEAFRFAAISNLGGGIVTLTSGAVGNNFLVSDRVIQFRYAYMSNDLPSSATHDQFLVQVDFFATATSVVPIGSTGPILVADRGWNTDTQTNFSPYDTAPQTVNDIAATTFNLGHLDVSPFVGSFARISFIVNNLGPAAGPSNGQGVSGVVLDNVVLTPEPSALALFAAGALGVGGLAWRRRRKAPAKA